MKKTIKNKPPKTIKVSTLIKAIAIIASLVIVFISGIMLGTDLQKGSDAKNNALVKAQVTDYVKSLK